MVKKNIRDKKAFSSANLFFFCVWLILIYRYFYVCCMNMMKDKPIFSILMMIIMCILTIIWLGFKFPLFIEIKNENLDDLYYDNIYLKEIGFLSNLFIGFFETLKQNNVISLFTGITIKLGIKNRESKFTVIFNPAKLNQRILDIMLTIVCVPIAYTVSTEIAKFGVFFGIIFSVYMIIFSYKRYILTYIYSVNIGKNGNYKINIMYPYKFTSGIFSKYYGFAYFKHNAILLHKDVLCSGEKLRNYIIAHEEGHLAHKSSIKSNIMMTIFIFITFLGISGPNIIYGIWKVDDFRTVVPLLLYLLFLSIYVPIAKAQAKKNEKLADIYAIEKIGKTAVIDGLKIIKNDNIKKSFNLSGTELDRRIDFVKTYNEK